MSKDQKSRREVISTLAKGVGFVGMGGLLWGAQLKSTKAEKVILRPPGALNEDDFIKSCTKCGACVSACPYDTLKLATVAENKVVGTPYFEPRDIPCYMCTDIPCVPACPSGSLDVSKLLREDADAKTYVTEDLDINKSVMGLAVVDPGSCIAYWGIQCDACYRVCPLIDEAIMLEYDQNDRTGKHALLKPKINADVCTGCGLCEHACVTEKAAIKVFPKDLVTGKVGGHYIKGWEKEDEGTLNETEQFDEDNKLSDKAMDYLNDWESLIDDE